MFTWYFLCIRARSLARTLKHSNFAQGKVQTQGWILRWTGGEEWRDFLGVDFFEVTWCAVKCCIVI